MKDALFKFEYDSDEDAMETLASYHQTSVHNIRSNWKELRKIYKAFVDSKNDAAFLSLIMACLKVGYLETKDQTFRVYFYHRTGSNGSLEWFSQGLLNSREGISSFAKNVHNILPQLNFLDYEQAMLSKDFQKHGGLTANCKANSVGPFAFYRLKDASHKAKYSFDLPEILIDTLNNDVYEELLSILQPTVVKFWIEKPIKYIDSYIIRYWKYLLGDQEAGDDVGKGGNIPFENIEKIIILPKMK